MIHPNTIIDILGESEGIMVKDLPCKFKVYSMGLRDITWEPYGIENPDLAATLSVPSRLLSLTMVPAATGGYIWYEVYFKETDKSVIVTADELLPCIYDANKIGLSQVADNNGKAAIPVTISDIKKMQDRKMRVTIPAVNPETDKDITGYYKPLIRRAYPNENQVAYRLDTTAGVYCSNGIMLMGISDANVNYWIARMNLHDLEV